MQALYFIFLSILHWSFSSKPFFQKKFYKICKYEIHQKAMASLRIFEENSENLKYVYRDIIWAISFNLSQIKKRVWNLSMERRISSFLRQKKRASRNEALRNFELSKKSTACKCLDDLDKRQEQRDNNGTDNNRHKQNHYRFDD